MTKKEREAHFISYINPNNLQFDNSLITKCSNCGCGLSNVAYYCPICGVKINERVVHSRDNSIIIYPSWVLNKIRAEINGLYRVVLKDTPKDDWAVRWNDCIDEVLQIIDKYKAESRGEE